ncbi:DUF1249 domain-containing protein [Pseudomaricurvus alkylphenolicus]|jgi:uncharacterized protein YqiB (DUF1249 family)|uniref:DUF1249 domain-containing protein n=1 Tax=Pseudomaricurvus alkylphenolicus TaxID=1306991 RepID=UPI001F0DF427|nr:DUF1249 domain-containing protein [Pseudomaricurvus alkylphenolicus]
MNTDRNHSKTADQRRYKVNLVEQMACCEANYARLLKLMPKLDERDNWQYQVQSGGSAWDIRLKVTERARYTTMLEVSQSDALEKWGSSPKLEVRLYHDARMAEVIAWREHQRVKPRYDYPNRNMYQKDEKAQFNQFLSDWLIHSLANGQVRELAEF